MNEPIISPWFFYLVSVADKLLAFTLAICVVAYILSIGFFLFSTNCYSEEERIKRVANSKKAFLIAFALSLIFILTPSSITLTKMVIAQQVTPSNINATGEVIEKGIDIISDKVIEVIKEMKK